MNANGGLSSARTRERSWSNGPGPNRIQMPGIHEGQSKHFIQIKGNHHNGMGNNGGYRADKDSALSCVVEEPEDASYNELQPYKAAGDNRGSGSGGNGSANANGQNRRLSAASGYGDSLLARGSSAASQSPTKGLLRASINSQLSQGTNAHSQSPEKRPVAFLNSLQQQFAESSV